VLECWGYENHISGRLIAIPVESQTTRAESVKARGETCCVKYRTPSTGLSSITCFRLSQYLSKFSFRGFHRTYRPEVQIDLNSGLDVGDCGLFTALPCQTLSYATKQYRRIALTYVISAGTPQFLLSDLVLREDSVIIRSSDVRTRANLDMGGGIVIEHAHRVEFQSFDFDRVLLTPNRALVLRDAKLGACKACRFWGNGFFGGIMDMQQGSSWTCDYCDFRNIRLDTTLPDKSGAAILIRERSEAVCLGTVFENCVSDFGNSLFLSHSVDLFCISMGNCDAFVLFF
jgi:hypothetical protein